MERETFKRIKKISLFAHEVQCTLDFGIVVSQFRYCFLGQGAQYGMSSFTVFVGIP